MAEAITALSGTTRIGGRSACDRPPDAGGRSGQGPRAIAAMDHLDHHAAGQFGKRMNLNGTQRRCGRKSPGWRAQTPDYARAGAGGRRPPITTKTFWMPVGGSAAHRLRQGSGVRGTALGRKFWVLGARRLSRLRHRCWNQGSRGDRPASRGSDHLALGLGPRSHPGLSTALPAPPWNVEHVRRTGTIPISAPRNAPTSVRPTRRSFVRKCAVPGARSP